MTDITISADAARAAAVILRLAAIKDAGFKGEDGTRYRAADLADLLDPPAPSLRDEVARQIEPQLLHDEPDTARMVAGDILAVVRRHVEALPVAGMPLAGSAIVLRDEVLRVLGGAE